MATIRPQVTLDDVKQLARQLGVTFTNNRDSFDLDKQEPLRLEGTYRANQAGINAAFNSLVRHQNSLRNIPQASDRRQSHHQRGGIGADGALALSLLAALVSYSIGTFAPQTRGITGPLTILFMFLIVVSGVMLALGHARK